MRAGQGLRDTAEWARASRAEVREAMSRGVDASTAARLAMHQLDLIYGELAELADEGAARVDHLVAELEREVIRGDHR